MRKLNVLLLVKRFQFGGAENHVCELANALSDHGHRVWLITGPGFQSDRLHPSVVHTVVRFADWKLIFHFFSLLKLIRSERIDIVHSHQRFPIFLGTLVAKWCKIPIVATVHGIWLTDLRTGFVRHHINKIIAIRESCYKNLKDSPALRSKVVMIPNGINIPKLPVTRKSNREGFRLFYVSRIDLHHAQLLKFILSEVWPQFICSHPDSIFYIIGEGSRYDQITQYWKAEKFNSYRDSVHFEGYCCDVPKIYPKADLVMGVGRVAIESLIYGVPLLSIKYNHLGPIVTRANLKKMQYANFVDLDAFAPTKSDMLLELNEFIANREFYENETAALKQIMHLEYNQDLIVNRIVEVYREVI